MLTIHVWPKRLKEFLLTHPLYKSPQLRFRQLELTYSQHRAAAAKAVFSHNEQEEQKRSGRLAGP